MNKYLKNLNRIEFVVTSACTGNCKHCSQGEHKSSENIDKNLAADAVRKISHEYKINSVMTFGGEPLLYSDTVCVIHSMARKMNIPNRQLITNGYFSKNSDKIKLVAEELIDCGANDILISVDAFHQETIPLNIVKRFAENMKNYAKNTDIKVFLISLKAGGTGLNLVGADTVIHYDPWWNFSAESQASDRVHRIGQKHNYVA